MHINSSGSLRRTVPVHGGDRLTASQTAGISPANLVDFSANIMPFGLSEAIRRAITEGLDSCCHYPDPRQRELRRQLADRHQLDPEQIVCGNGAADVLYRTIQVLRPKRVFLPVPTFLEYAKACREQQARIVPYPLPAERGFAVTWDLLTWLTEQTKGAPIGTSSPSGQDLLILCNPNNPTGLLIEPALLHRIAAVCRKRRIWLLIDECFLDFTDREAAFSLMADLRSPDTEPFLLILRSMTKFFALPGLRLGYLCTSPDLACVIRAAGQPWPVSSLAEIAGLAALQEWRLADDQTRRSRQDWLQTERERLRAALAAQGWQVFPGSANFLFFRAADCPDLADRLLEHRLLIRSCANYPGLGPDYYRIAVRTVTENQQLIDAIEICKDQLNIYNAIHGG